MKKTEQLNWFEKTQKVKVQTPYLLIDLKKVDEKIQEFRLSFPECDLYYAVKAFNGKQLLDHIDNRVDGYDVASMGEIEQLMKLGVDPARLLFSNPVKIPGHIRKSFKRGVRYYAFDSHNELQKIANDAPGSNVYLRIKVSDQGSAFPLSRKFGAILEHAVPLMATAKELGLNPCGLTFHVGSQSESLQTWDDAIEKCGTIMKRLGNVGIKLDFIDIGGGFPATYTEKVPDIRHIATTLRKSMRLHLPYKVKLKAEPGRFIVAEAGLMVSTVVGREHRISNNWLFLDIGTFNGLIEPLEIRNWKYPMFVEKSLETDSIPEYFTITGPSCDAHDTLGFDIPLPSNVATGDKVYIGSAGAYSVVYASNFNGFNIPKAVYIN